MNIVDKIDLLRKQKGWSVNKLAYESTITQSTLANMFSTRAEPKISTLKMICDAFGISLSEFFYEKDEMSINPKSLELLYYYEKLDDGDRQTIFALTKSLSNKTK